MKFEIKQQDLLWGVQRVLGVVERRNTLPILSHISISALMTGESSEISMFATDLEIGICNSYTASILVPGQITCPARKLLDITRALPEGIVNVEEIENHWLSIRSGNAHFKIAGLPPEQFPVFPPPDDPDTKEIQITIDPEIFLSLIGKTLFTAGENDARYILNGVLVQMQRVTGEKERMRLVATDGHRLSIAEDTVQIHRGGFEEESVIVPKKGMIEIKRLLEHILSKNQESENRLELVLKSTTLTARYGKSVVISRLLHGNFPKYQQVIPQGCDHKIEVSRSLLLGAVSRVSALSEDKTFIVEMSLQTGQIRFDARSPEFGEAFESVPTSFCGNPLVLRFVAHNLCELLSVIEDDPIILEIKDQKSACMIQEKSGHGIFVFTPTLES